MQRCEVGDIRFNIIDQWYEMPLHIARDLHKLCRTEMPDSLKLKYELIRMSETQNEAEEKLTEWALNTKDSDFTEFYLNAVEILADDEIPRNITKDSAEYLYLSFVDLLVFGLLYEGCTHSPSDIVTFEHNGIVYDLPREKKIFDLTISMEGITMIQFSEFNDLMALISSQPNGFDFLSTAIAVLALPEGELYDEDSVKQVAKEFETLPMDIVWDVFFYSDSLWNTVEEDSVICLEEKGATKAHRDAVKLIEWDGEETLLTSPKIVEAFSQFPILKN